MKKNITMADIAREAGVSRTTASYVLNGQYATMQISEGTRLRVQEAARALGYRRNELARAIVTGKNRVLGVLARRPGPEPRARILEGILEEAGRRGYTITLLHHASGEEGSEIARRCVEQRLAGLIVDRPSRSAYAALHAELAHYQLPIVLVDDSITHSGTLTITSDDVQGCRLAVAHLVGLGHRHIVQIEGSPLPTPLLRAEAFRRAMAEHGLSVQNQAVAHTDWTPEQVEQAVNDLFHARRKRPTALFCSAGDSAAAVAIRTLRQIGLHTPADVSVVGYSDLTFADYVDPPLTTIAQPFQEMGRTAVRCLLERIENEDQDTNPEPAELLLPTQLVRRASTGPAASI